MSPDDGKRDEIARKLNNRGEKTDCRLHQKISKYITSLEQKRKI